MNLRLLISIIDDSLILMVFTWCLCVLSAKLILHLFGPILVGEEVTKDVDITEINTVLSKCYHEEILQITNASYFMLNKQKFRCMCDLY